MAEITDQGYVLKTQNEYFEEEVALYEAIPNVTFNLDPSTPDGLKVAHDAEVFGALDEVMQQAYNSKDPNKATNDDLDVLCDLTGTTREDGTPSTVTLTLYGIQNTMVWAGSIAESYITGYQFAIDYDTTIGTDGTITCSATCTVDGPVEADIGTITKIKTTIGGWTGVNNLVIATPGSNRESDSDLRVKRASAVGRPGNNQLDSMIGEIFAVEDVRRCKVYENDTGSADVSDDNPYGLPAHSISPLIDGGTDADIGLAIYLKKNPGVMLNQAGSAESVVVVSPKYQNNTKTIKFSRPLYVDMTIEVTIKSDGTLPSDIDTEIKDAIIEFAAGDLIEADCGFKTVGFDIGEDVPVYTVSTPINQVIGSYGNSYIQSMTVNGLSAGVVDIDYNELSRWTESNITVTIV